MKSAIFCARFAVLPVALSAVFPVFAQNVSNGALQEVVVKASRFAEDAQALPYGVSVITVKDIENSGALTVNEAIMRVLGVPGRLDTSGANNYSLDLRGFGETAGSNQVVVVDGIRMNEQDLGGSALSSVPIEQVQRIEVIRGNGAVVYGEGATGGVILVTTKAGEGIARQNSAQVSAIAGSFGLHEIRSSATVAAGGLSVDVSGSDRSSDGHRENFASNINNLSATVQWKNEWVRFGVQSGRSILHTGLPGSLTAVEYDADAHQARTKKDYGDVKNESSRLFLDTTKSDWQFGADIGTRTKSYATQYVDSAYTYGYAVNADNANLRARNESRSANFVNALSVGYDNSRWKRNELPSGVSQSDSNAIYVSDDITYLPSATRLALGYRFDRIQKSDASGDIIDDKPNAWTVGVTQDLGGGKNIYSRVGQSYRMANVDEINATDPTKSLQTQTSKDLEIGARWQYPSGYTELRWYRSDLINEIGYDNNIGLYGANVNYDPTQRQGVELESRNAITTQTALRVSEAVRQSRFREGVYSDKEVPLAPNQTLALGGEWTPRVGHLLYAGVNWVSSQHPGSDFNNACSMPAYTTADAHYAYTAKNAEFALGLTNLMDAKYYTQAYRCSLGVTNGIYPEAGRAVAATVKFKF